MNHILTNAKGYAALVGALATALLGVYGPDTQTGHILVVVGVMATAFATWRVPNSGTYVGKFVGESKPETRVVVTVDAEEISKALRQHQRRTGKDLGLS